MSLNITATYTSGLTLYYFVFNQNSQVFNGSGFIDFNAEDWATYVFPLTEVSSGEYAGTFPSLAAGIYYIIGYQQTTDTPSSVDANSRVLFGMANWNGSGDIGGGGLTLTAQFDVGVIDDPMVITTGVDNVAQPTFITGIV